MPRPGHLSRSLPGWSLAVLCLALTLLGCNKAEAPAPKSDPNRVIWKQLGVALADNNLGRVALLRVDDTVGKSAHVERQVQQAILAELTLMSDLQVLETDQQQVNIAISKHKTDPVIGIPSAMAMDLCQDLKVDAFIYATVENSDYDINLKLYTGSTGTIIFTKTLQDLELPGSAMGGMPSTSTETADLSDPTAGRS